jgi:methylmalonyl-CoA mutase N-terminal domain/subunit
MRMMEQSPATEESVRRAMAIQLVLIKELGLAKNEIQFKVRLL